MSSIHVGLPPPATRSHKVVGLELSDSYDSLMDFSDDESSDDGDFMSDSEDSLSIEESNGSKSDNANSSGEDLDEEE